MDGAFSQFHVQVQEFKGPLEVLLELVEKRKLHISDVALAQVTDDFVAYIQSIKEYPFADITSFILVASTLLLIKSKALLPTLELTDEEVTTVSDLEKRLKILSIVKEGVVSLNSLWGSAYSFECLDRPQLSVFTPDPRITTTNLTATFEQLLSLIPQAERLQEVQVATTLKIEEVIGDLKKRVEHALQLPFSQFAGDKKTKVNIIVSFLALLELVKAGELDARQDSANHDIMIETKRPGVPHY